jgi:stage V sporulation protein G
MKITCAKVLPVKDDEKLKAFVTIVIDDCLVIKDLKVIRGAESYFIAMPAKQTKDGRYVDIAHPLNKETRDELEKTILDEYNRITRRTPSSKEGAQGTL